MFTKSIFFFTWTFPFFHDRFSQYVHIHVIVKYITKITHYIFGELLCVNFLRGAVAVYQIESTRTADGWLDLEEAVYGAVCLVHVSADGADNNNVILLRVNNFLLFVGEGVFYNELHLLVKNGAWMRRRLPKYQKWMLSQISLDLELISWKFSNRI